MKKISFSATLLFFVVMAAFAQEQTVHRVLTWKSPVETVISESEKIQSLFFEGASYDENGLPVYYERIAIGSARSSKAIIENAVYEPLKETGLIPSKAEIGSAAAVKCETGIRRKKSFACITVSPFRKSASGTIEKLVSFDLKTTPSSAVDAKMRGSQNPVVMTQRIYAANSVLASGDWYKVGVTQSGVVKITSKFLKEMGIEVNKIDPRNIRLYSNGGGQLPYYNNTLRYDDLQEDAIYVEGESDGKFNTDDYILFFGERQTTWTYDTTAKKFTHSVNLYSDTTYYFLTIGASPGKRIQTIASSSLTPTNTITSFDDYDYHEADLVNHLKSGREWYGEIFDNLRAQQSYVFSMPNNISSEPVKVTANVLGKSCNDPTNFNLSLNGSPLDAKVVPHTSCNAVTADFANQATLQGSVMSSTSSLNVGLGFSSTETSANGWLNYAEINVRRSLSYLGVGNALLFRDVRSVGAGNIGQFILASVPSGIRIWNVTDPLNIVEQQASVSSGQASFTVPTTSLQEFIAFNGSAFAAPVFAGHIANQNLHSMKAADMLIVTNSKFLTQAHELADFHRKNDGLKVNVATTAEVFNEFSSGSQDVSAIRDFAKMFYDRFPGPDSTTLKFLLLFGDCSYDNKYRMNGNTNYVTSYQSAASLNLTNTYISDDFFGLLDSTEGDWSPNNSNELLDISVGRLPVKSETEAEGVVKKIISYSSPDDAQAAQKLTCGVPNLGSTSTYGDWRNIVSFVGDDQDQNTHFNQAESLAQSVSARFPVYNLDKIYLDAYKQVSTPGGQRYPEARDAIVKRVQRGTLLMTYIGHGGEVGWAHERVLEDEDINGWTNFKQLSAFLTATCEFSRPDDPARTSAGELVLLNPNGGGICLFTTTRLAFSGSNFSLAQKFFDHFFVPVNGKMPTSGEVFEETKVDYNDRYTRNFLLLGDPAVRVCYPQNNIVTTTVNAHPIFSASDTLKALSKITITGEVRDQSGNKMTSFNGIVYPTVYDKWATYHTLGNDLGWTGDGGQSYPAPFNLQKNILYKGKSQVKNGEFSYTFIVPKDITYKYGFGKLSYYAANGLLDANGYDTSIVVGGLNSAAAADNAGPQIKLYLNDDKFVFGGITGANPILYATVTDENGINTIGNGIGHDITSVMDGDNSKTIVLNDYYEADMDNYKTGSVRYPFNSLAEGRHTLTFKVWDVYNNSSEARTEFVIASGAKMALDHVLNYPNPFTTHTTFMFEHNRAYCDLDAQVQIFTVSGKLVKTIDKLIYAEGYHSSDIEWDGRDDYGDKIGRGVYVYKLRVKACDGTTAEKFEKLVILR